MKKSMHTPSGNEIEEQSGPTRIWNKGFVSLLIINLVVMMGNYMLRPIISNYAIELGATVAVAGVVAGLAFAVATILRPVTGYLADRLNKKTSLVISTVAFAVGAIGCALSQSVAFVGLCCAIQGVALSFQAIGLMSLATLSVPRARIGTAVGWMSIVMTATMAVGPGVTAQIAAWGGYRASFTAGGILCCIGLVLIGFFKAPPGSEGSKNHSEDGESRFTISSLLKKSFYAPTVPIAIAALLAMWSGSSVSTLLFTIESSGYLSDATWYFVVYALVAIGTRPVAGWLCDRFRSVIVAVPLLFLGAGAMVLLVFGHDLPAIVACGALMGGGQGSALSVIQAESVRGVDVEHLGRATNTYYVGVDLGGFLGAWVGGFLIQIGTPALMFGFNAFTSIASAAVLIVLVAAHKRPPMR